MSDPGIPNGLDPESIAKAYRTLRMRLDALCSACGRDPADVTLVAVTKNTTAPAALAAVRAGATDLGENRVQELLAKQEAFASASCSAHWHLIGTLQTRKVRQVIGRTVLIHSMDRLKLAYELSARSAAAGIRTSVLMQVNLAGEESKHGFSFAETDAALKEITGLPNLSLEGLMTMAPIQPGLAPAEEVFGQAAALRDRWVREGRVDPDVFRVLSMGMSGDYEAAIRAGSTHVRIGSALFGPPRQDP